MKKEKKNGKAIDNPQTKTTKEYTRQTRSESRKNTPIDLETATPTIDDQELMRQLDVKMKES